MRAACSIVSGVPVAATAALPSGATPGTAASRPATMSKSSSTRLCTSSSGDRMSTTGGVAASASPRMPKALPAHRADAHGHHPRPARPSLPGPAGLLEVGSRHDHRVRPRLRRHAAEKLHRDEELDAAPVHAHLVGKEIQVADSRLGAPLSLLQLGLRDAPLLARAAQPRTRCRNASAASSPPRPGAASARWPFPTRSCGPRSRRALAA